MFNREESWKNFTLGKELNIAGMFIYNGLLSFHQIKYFLYEEKIFEFLYNTSIGIERLFKIAIILIEHDSTISQEEFENSLITHNHSSLLDRIKKKQIINFSKSHNEFLALLAKFYKVHRYARFNFNEIENLEQKELIAFLEKHLNISIDITTEFAMTRNNIKIKKYIGKVISKIATDIYKIIQDEAHRLNLYTYEVRYDSKAAKIFMAKEYDFEEEDLLKRELLVYFVNSTKGSHVKLMREEIEPLDFDPGAQAEYIGCFNSYQEAGNIKEELDGLYETAEMSNKDIEKRKELLFIIEDIIFDEEWGFDDETEEEE